MTKTIEEQQKKVDRIDTFVSRHYDYGCHKYSIKVRLGFVWCFECRQYKDYETGDEGRFQMKRIQCSNCLKFFTVPKDYFSKWVEFCGIECYKEYRGFLDDERQTSACRCF